MYAEYPDINVELLTGNRVFDLNRNEVDIAIRLVATERDDLVVRHVSRVGWGLYASPTYLAGSAPETPTCWTNHRVIHFEETLRGTPGQRWLNEHTQGAVVAMRGNSMPSCAEAAAAGLGIACLPCLYGDRNPRLLSLGPPVTNGDVWLAAHPERLKIKRIRVVWDFLHELATLERALITGIP